MCVCVYLVLSRMHILFYEGFVLLLQMFHFVSQTPTKLPACYSNKTLCK